MFGFGGTGGEDGFGRSGPCFAGRSGTATAIRTSSKESSSKSWTRPGSRLWLEKRRSVSMRPAKSRSDGPGGLPSWIERGNAGRGRLRAEGFVGSQNAYCDRLKTLRIPRVEEFVGRRGPFGPITIFDLTIVALLE